MRVSWRLCAAARPWDTALGVVSLHFHAAAPYCTGVMPWRILHGPGGSVAAILAFCHREKRHGAIRPASPAMIGLSGCQSTCIHRSAASPQEPSLPMALAGLQGPEGESHAM